MSFGAPASDAGERDGFVRVPGDRPCPCGSGDRFDGCCRPVLAGGDPPTAERLMRSRYTAFVVGDAGHLLATWHPGTRPPELELSPSLRWTGLEVIDVVDGRQGDTRGIVEFRAGWRDGSESGVLHERSRFVRQSDRWWYLDGRVR